jgi:hypothetical protein
MNLQFLVRQRGRLPENLPVPAPMHGKRRMFYAPRSTLERIFSGSAPPFRTFFISALPRQLVHQFGPFALHDRTHVIGK